MSGYGMSEETTTLFLIRHGETEWNTQSRIQGCLDSPLTEIGEIQADLTGQCLQNLSIDSLYCSKLGRATNTANEIAKSVGLNPISYKGLEERRFGKLEGMTRFEAQEKFEPSIFDRMYGEENCSDFGVESLTELRDRVMNALREIVVSHPGKRIAVVTHGGCLHMVFKDIVGLPLSSPRRFSIRNCAVNRITIAKDWTIDQWGQSSHLDGSEDEA